MTLERNVIEVLLNAAMALVLAWAVSFAYRLTHPGKSYDRRFNALLAGIAFATGFAVDPDVVQLLCGVCFIFVAFTRMSVKSPRDPCYLLLSICLGLACAWPDWLVAGTCMLSASAVILIIHQIDMERG